MAYDNQKQYQEGDQDTTIRGNAIMWEESPDTLQPVNVSKPLPVTLPSSFIPPAAITGYALETTLQSIKTALETIDNFISGSKGLVTEDNSAAIKTAVEKVDDFISGSRGLVTEDNSAAIKTAVQDKSVALTTSQWVTVAKAGTDGDVIAAPSASNHLEIYHISVNNAGANDTNFQLVSGSGGSVFREYTLAKNGGTVEAQFNPPVRMGSATALYYNWISGASADINISVHYKTVAD